MVPAEWVEVGDAVPCLPRCCGSHGGGREQHAGQGVAGADAGGGPGRAVLRCPGRLYAVRHQILRTWQASHVQAVGARLAACVPAGAGAAPK